MKITSIFQDEPTNGGGDGNTTIDGFGVGSSQASVRAERSALHNGRVYYISFSADDRRGGTCSGQVTVSVPHDMAHPAIGDGAKYDSTKATPPSDEDEHHGCGESQDHDNDRGRAKDDHDKKHHNGKNSDSGDNDKKQKKG